MSGMDVNGFCDSIYSKARAGLPLDGVSVIDAHAHLGYMHLFHVPCATAESLLPDMDALGIDCACISAFSSLTADYRYGNNLVMEAVAKYPDRFIGYVAVNPNYAEDMRNELDRCFAAAGMMAIKLHPALHGHPPDHMHYRAAFEMADENEMTVLVHTWGAGDVAGVDRIAGLYPGANFIMGHSGADIRAMEATIDIVNKRDNVLADLTISLTHEGNVEWFVKEMGSEKILFGSDMPYFSPCPNLGRIAMARIGEEDKRNILGRNMKKLLKM